MASARNLPVVVRPATPSDEPVRRSLFRQRVTSELGLSDPSVVELQWSARFHGYVELGVTYWMIEATGDVVGELAMILTETRHHGADIYIDADYRRRGIAARVVRWMIARADAAGAELTVSVDRANGASYALCTGLGFVEVGGDQHSVLLRHQ